MIDETSNEYLDLPDDPETAFAVLHRRAYSELEAAWETQGNSGWYLERRYVDKLLAFDEVYDLGILTAYKYPPTRDSDFSDFFQDFRRAAEVSSLKIFMEAARRQKTGAETILRLEAPAREAIHKLINALRQKLHSLKLSDDKKEALFARLNAFALEVDRDRTRAESMFAFAVEFARTGRTVNDEIKPLQDTIDRILGILESAKRWKDSLPKWAERKKISGPSKFSVAEPPLDEDTLDDDIPF